MEWVANVLEWIVAPFDSLNAHQLDVLRTLSGIVGTILSGFAVAATVYARLARRDAKAAREQTVTRDWKAGVLREVSVAETARHLARDGAATREDPSEPADWTRGSGRRREPTRDVPRIDPRSLR